MDVPPKANKNSGNVVVCEENESHQSSQSKNSNSIDLVTEIFCLFPSLLIDIISFEADEDRVEVEFDVIKE